MLLQPNSSGSECGLHLLDLHVVALSQVDGTYDDDWTTMQVDGTEDGEGEQQGGAEEQPMGGEEQEQLEEPQGEAGEQPAAVEGGEPGLEGLGDPTGDVGLPDSTEQLPLMDPTATGSYLTFTGDLCFVCQKNKEIFVLVLLHPCSVFYERMQMT